ncbi:MAG TPA: MoxR family ATPase, partial [Pirellulaceae bacterium]|nr:MoxR family ATPase [Pirellulaceae bacterium]
TQNPVESHGAFPLPEAQLDRFAMKLRIGYPDRASEIEMLSGNVGVHSAESRDTPAVLDPRRLRELQEHVAGVAVSRVIHEYLVDLAAVTRSHRAVTLGLSPRGLITWQRVAQAWAHLHGRDFVTPDDVQSVALPVLDVRLSGDFDSAPRIVDEILQATPVPVPIHVKG